MCIQCLIEFHYSNQNLFNFWEMYSTFDNTSGHESVELSKDNDKSVDFMSKYLCCDLDRNQIRILSVIIFSNVCLGIIDTIYESFFPEEVKILHHLQYLIIYFKMLPG